MAVKADFRCSLTGRGLRIRRAGKAFYVKIVLRKQEVWIDGVLVRPTDEPTARRSVRQTSVVAF
jgi:hypothetical protein